MPRSPHDASVPLRLVLFGPFPVPEKLPDRGRGLRPGPGEAEAVEVLEEVMRVMRPVTE